MARRILTKLVGRTASLGGLFLAVACGSDSESSGTGARGTTDVTASGGAIVTGGTLSSSGAQPSGATSGLSTGGTPTATGATAGGAGGAGGTAVSTGGAESVGGSSGGTAGNGGTKPSGGSPNVGGTQVASGGVLSTGGDPNAGGVQTDPNTGGVQTTGGATNTGGLQTTGGAAETPDIGPRACGCDTPTEEFGTVDQTIVVGSGEVYDGQCKIFRANPSTLGPGDQSEDQSPVFRVNDGGTLRNVVLGASAADGIHLYGDVVLENIHWLDIGEDAMTVKRAGTVNLDCGSATNGEDKMFQVNAESEIHISNFTGSHAGKFMRQNGDTTFRVDVTIDHCDISDMDEVIFRTDSSTSHVTLTNTRYSGLGKGLFMFGSSVVDGDSNQSTVTHCEAY